MSKMVFTAASKVAAFAVLLVVAPLLGWSLYKAICANQPAWLAAGAASSSLIIAATSIFVAWLAVTRTYRPVVVFVRDDEQRWRIVNIGKGPALDIVVVEKSKASTPPRRFVRYPPLGEGKEFLFEPRDGSEAYEAQYRDAEGTLYATECVDYKNSLRPKPSRIPAKVELYGDIQDRKLRGEFFLVQLQPNADPQRVIMGHAHRLEEHIRAIRKTHPTAEILCSWPSMRSWEAAAIASLAGETFSSREGNSFTGDPGEFRRRGAAFFSSMPTVPVGTSQS